MPCKCSGVRIEQCDCNYLGKNIPLARSRDAAFFLLAKDSACYMQASSAASAKRNVVTRAVERIYEKCASYNLRYCLLQRHSNSNDRLGHALYDVVILFCFFLANFVVFLTIIARMTVNVSCLLMKSVQWIKRSFTSKLSQQAVSTSLSSIPRHKIHNCNQTSSLI